VLDCRRNERPSFSVSRNQKKSHPPLTGIILLAINEHREASGGRGSPFNCVWNVLDDWNQYVLQVILTDRACIIVRLQDQKGEGHSCCE